jgi:hypothetical protein
MKTNPLLTSMLAMLLAVGTALAADTAADNANRGKIMAGKIISGPARG